MQLWSLRVAECWRERVIFWLSSGPVILLGMLLAQLASFTEDSLTLLRAEWCAQVEDLLHL